MQRGRISALDHARAFAIIGVVAVHLSFQFPHLPQWAKVIARMGQYGVQLFFVISAITIFMTLDADRQRYQAPGHVTTRFYIKRFFRIAPLYYVAIAAYGAMSWYTYNFQSDHASILGPHDALDVLLNLLFVHAVSASAINNVVPGGWSIGVEMLFYLIAPAIFFYATNRTRLFALSGLLLLVCAAFLSTGACGGELDCNVRNNSFFYFWPPVQVPCFLIGIWCWHKFRRHLTGRANLSPRGVFASVSVAALCGLGAAVFGVWLGLANELAPVVAAIGSAALLLLCCSGVAPRLAGRITAALGRESYAIYLWHFVFAFEALYLFKNSAFLAAHGPAVSLLVFALAVAFTLAASYLLSRLTDRLVQRVATRLSHALLARVDTTFAFRTTVPARAE
jgi:peptidoglycan/LPS O-acetylase OafA/YrhL